MKQSALARKQAQTRDVANAAMEGMVAIVRVGLTETVRAKPGEDLHVALNRCIDERIAYNRWYRRLWRALTRWPLDALEEMR